MTMMMMIHHNVPLQHRVAADEDDDDDDDNKEGQCSIATMIKTNKTKMMMNMMKVIRTSPLPFRVSSLASGSDAGGLPRRLAEDRRPDGTVWVQML